MRGAGFRVRVSYLVKNLNPQSAIRNPQYRKEIKHAYCSDQPDCGKNTGEEGAIN